jgi:hypothetical protein
MNGNRRADSRQCRCCHCTDAVACSTAEGECYWIEDDLCSACAGIDIGLELVAERLRQRDEEGFSTARDDAHQRGELAMAAAAYASFATYSDHRRAGQLLVKSRSPLWPAAFADFWKPKDRRQDLIRAGALIIAEIERLDRQARATVAALAGEERRAS